MNKQLLLLYVLSDAPVSVDEAGIDVVGSLHSSDRLQTHSARLVWHDVDEPVFELVAWQVGTDKARGVRFGVGQFL